MSTLFQKVFAKFQQHSEGKNNDFSVVKTDMHSHLLPGLDDGVKTMEESITLITQLYHLGFTKLITTPHIISDSYHNTPDTINKGLREVKEAVVNNGLPITIEAAAEYYIDENFISKLEQDALLTFGKKYLLFEVSYINCPDNFKEIVFKMQLCGYQPVLAHVERYPFWFGKFEQYEKMKDSGILFQININSLTGYYSYPAKKTAEKLIGSDFVDFIGTDLHHSKHLDLLKKCTKEKYFGKVIHSPSLLNSQL